MKIFWSWQSDTDGKTGRFFVRDALEEAIKQLKQPPDVEEPTSPMTIEGVPDGPLIFGSRMSRIGDAVRHSLKGT